MNDIDVHVVCGLPADLDGAIAIAREHDDDPGMRIAAEVYEEVRDGKLPLAAARDEVLIRQAEAGV